MSKNFVFNEDIAKKYGVDGAIIIQNLYYWIEHNAANDKHFYDGRYWTYNSQKAFAELFPFWTINQIKRIVTKLKKAGAIHVGNYNKNPYDHTAWYALDESVLKILNPNFINEVKSEEETHELQVGEETHQSQENTQKSPWLSIVRNRPIDSVKSPNRRREIPRSIYKVYTDINTYINKKNKKEKEFFWKKSGVVNQVHQGSEQKTSYNLDELLMKSGLYLPD